MKTKTWKRELAVVMLLWLVYLVETKDVNIVEVLVWPVFTFAALSFGLDWFGKSGGMQQPFVPSDRGRTQRSGERTGREEQLPNSRDYDK